MPVCKCGHAADKHTTMHDELGPCMRCICAGFEQEVEHEAPEVTDAEIEDARNELISELNS